MKKIYFEYLTDEKRKESYLTEFSNSKSVPKEIRKAIFLLKQYFADLDYYTAQKFIIEL